MVKTVLELPNGIPEFVDTFSESFAWATLNSFSKVFSSTDYAD